MNSTPIHQHIHSPVIFSFGQQNPNQGQPTYESESLNNTCRSKLQFVERLINRYEQTPKRFPFKRNSSSQRGGKQVSVVHLLNSSKLPLSTGRHQHENSATQDFHSTKDESSIVSTSKSELEHSHQKILEKYKTPIQKVCQNSLNTNEYQSKILQERTIFEFLCSEQFSEKSQTPDQKSDQSDHLIPLIESLVMFEEKSESLSRQAAYTKDSRVREISEFQICKKIQQSDQLKMSQLLVLCGLILLFLCCTI